ncbi:MAG: helix-turn-helix transcriptional regulator [Spirochaetaceae bacterium]|nr:helix-turn-helix transcriptional regulator [Spirochaetaceae bacterium]
MDEYQQEFIDNLKKQRKMHGLSQEKFAELCDVSSGTIGNIECGMAKPSFDLLITMGKVLGIHPALLLSDKPLETNQLKSAEEHTMLFSIYKNLENHFKEN